MRQTRMQGVRGVVSGMAFDRKELGGQALYSGASADGSQADCRADRNNFPGIYAGGGFDPTMRRFFI